MKLVKEVLFDTCETNVLQFEEVMQDPYDDGDFTCVESMQALPNQTEDHGCILCYSIMIKYRSSMDVP